MKRKTNKSTLRLMIIISLIIICIIGLIGFFIISNKKNNVSIDFITTTKQNETTKNKKSTTTMKKTTTSSKTTKTTSQKTTTKEITETNETVIKNVISVEEGNEIVKEETKYGVIETKIKYYEIITYSDGSTEKLTKRFETNFNRDGYNGNTNSFKSEANAIANSNQSIYQSVLNYTNQYRNEVGATNLVLDNNLSLAATIRALEIAWSGNVSHTRPDSTLFKSVLDELGYIYEVTGENIAAGYSSAASVSEGWKNSPGHYENMIRSEYGKIGIGMAEVDDTKYWVQIFTD